MKVIGLDLSLTSTGIAVITTTGYAAHRIKPPADLRGLTRMRWIRQNIDDLIVGITLVVVEGPAYGAQSGQSGHHERAGLWWLVRERVESLVGEMAIVPPAVLKKYATGRGNASKDEVLAATIRQWPAFEGSSNDAADALWLAGIGADKLGQPAITVPDTRRAALGKVEWPAGIGGAR